MLNKLGTGVTCCQGDLNDMESLDAVSPFPNLEMQHKDKES